MSGYNIDKDRLKRIFNQISGTPKDDDDLVPEMAIRGSGYIWCYDPNARAVTRVSRGIKCYVVDETKDKLERILVYTSNNDVILIEEEELIYTGFD
tara:strand:- start:6627 stop:6914 length:288 start_codon:yes stop_codon:yes gene_type:complete